MADPGGEAVPAAASVEEFFQRYPCDSRAHDYLNCSGDQVIDRALREFKPPREGDTDYSALVMAFVRNLRAEVAAGNAGPNAAAAAAMSPEEMKAQLDTFMQQYPLDESAYNYLMNSSPEVQLRVIREFHPRTQGEADYSALCITFTKKCRQSTPSAGAFAGAPGGAPHHGGAAIDPDALAAAVEDFVRRYPVDQDTYNYIKGSPPEAQSQLLRDFRPKREGEADYSALVISFAKRCRTSVMMSTTQPLAAPGGYGAPRGGVNPHRIMQSGEYQAFRARYPFDEEAHNYLANSPPEVQLAVIQNFQPQREGEADYSALLIAFSKRCRQSLQQMGGTQHPAPAWGHPAPSGYGYGGRGAPQGYGAAPPADVAGFLARFPMDERAYAYLLACPPEVQHQVVNTFQPPRMDDTDFSAPVTAYAKACRSRMAAAQAPPPHVQSLGHMMHDPAAEIGAFCRRYPMDERALAYLRESPPGVVARVLREFQPKREGDHDYSAAIMAFVSVCRKANGFVAGGGVLGNPAKRPRMYY